ncbi:amino acid ABC transporter permease [Paenibacillus sp. NEAU-GSW1]|uniref:amino acid ABC transporter permease n=1 Tax=Paenibacillus sp. NEAU-GSW1 TaxID=2682486 RepID=UPI0012E2F17F|nr:amino acid ABC transporter permease [Paenibacillus sp. NEAU-GSW1]MUT66864.1 ABC transporter permease subunit [Paenibacillus sp. NEAU-GSW1]
MGQQAFDPTAIFGYIIQLLPFLRMTLLIVGGSILIGLFIGLIVALPRLYRIPLLKQLSQIYVSFFRGTPILIQLFLFYYGVPEFLKLFQIDASRTSAIYFVILTYALHSGAYISEVIRGAVEAVDRGQVEAAYAIGMNSYQAFVRIVLPQALAISIPVFANVVTGNLKDTSLAFSVGIMDITGKARTVGALTQQFVEIYIALTLIYFLLSYGLQKLFAFIERRLMWGESVTTAVRKAPRRRASKFRLDAAIRKEETGQ